MGVAFETVGFTATNPGSAATAVTMASGDSATVRTFPQTSRAHLMWVTRIGTTEGYVQILSPKLHDNVIGLRFRCSETPAVVQMPPESMQRMYSGDTLVINLTGGTNEKDAGALTIHYDDLPGAAQTLRSWGDIAGIIEAMHTCEVQWTDSATSGTWVDTAMNNNQDQFKASRYYAVLGWTADLGTAAVAVKGSMTSNMRYGGPGTTSTDDTSNWYIDIGRRHGMPSIPVFDGANKAATYASGIGNGTGSAQKVVFNLALLDQSFVP